MKKIINVVGAIIEENQKILCALRSDKMSNPNLWEFPGGKIEAGENLFETITREIMEELDCLVSPSPEIFNENIHETENVIIRLITVKCKIISGRPVAKEHARLTWQKINELYLLKWAPADLPAVNLLLQEKN